MRILPAILCASLAWGAKPVDFVRDVRTILSDHCFSCHGPDESKRMAGLRLDTRDGAFAKKGERAYIVPGNSAASLLVERVAHAKPALRMPPASTQRPLTETQIALLRRWIDEGAKWDEHWSYRPVRKPEVPAARDRKWIRNEIDAFVAARLDRESLKPAPEADRAAVLRRVTLDLTGLPPTPEETRAFLADRSATAYETVVNRLLASPHYGERMALGWLDLARYADTHGYHIDSHRDMWAWRDWVISAFNRNMPYDRFTVEQIAGDMLPDATAEQKLATGFHRNHMINFEGGAIDEEYHLEYLVDRVETTSNVWLGMTMGCARCHDHKYDPISQRDFYRFVAFFNAVPEKGLDGRKGNAEPYLFVTSDGQRREIRDIAERIEELTKALAEKKIAPEQKAWEDAPRRSPDRVTAGVRAHYEFDASLADVSGGYRYATASGEPDFVTGAVGKSLSLVPEDRVAMAAGLALPARFTLAFWLRIGGDKQVHVATFGGLKLATGEPVYIPDNKLGARLELSGPGGSWRTAELVQFAKWIHFGLEWDGARWRLLIDGTESAVEGSEPRPGGSADLTVSGYRGQIDDLRLYEGALPATAWQVLAVDHAIDSALAIPAAKRGREEKARLRDHFLRFAAPEPLRAQYSELRVLEDRKLAIERMVPSVMVMEDGAARDTFVLGRGDYRNKGEKVTPGVPSALPPLPAGAEPNRLGLARWLVDPQNPRTARVAVNRFWQQLLGTGLVKTSEDFGSQGDIPTHADLLDWLAAHFVESGWDVKALQRLIVTSATYRQSSRVSPDLLERDPENRLLARGSRFRLPAELIRDNALAAAGLLNRDIGGPSVLPYQPPGLWEEMAFGGTFSRQRYEQSHGRDLYRRGIYTFWKRTVPPASLATFDAPDREKCTSRRSVTNTPLQALVLMNDPTYVEAARHLAERMIAAGPDPARRIHAGFERLLGRRPEPRETAVLAEIAARENSRFAADPTSADQLLAIGESPRDRRIPAPEHAAWTNVATVLLNLDEAVTRE